jgi:lipopolysaccharide export system permease protein
MLSQLLWLFGFFSLVLVLVYWVNRAVSLFDQLIANGHSALVFLEFTALTLPNVIRLVLPVSAFAGALYVTNRLSAESELVAVQATGYSPARLARPVLTFGLIVALLMSVLTHVLVPMSLGRFYERSAEIAQNATARLLSAGEFIHPSEGTSFYVREITPEGELHDIFLSDARNADRRVTYTASRALLLRHEAGPRLVMFDGMAQVYETERDALTVTRFRDFTYNVGAIIDTIGAEARTLREVRTGELLFGPAAVAVELDMPLHAIRHEAHSRFTQALKGALAPLLGFSVLLLGGFSRFGLWPQMLAAVFAVIGFEAADSTLSDLVRRGTLPWPLAYLPAVATGLAVAALLHRAGAPRRARGVLA